MSVLVAATSEDGQFKPPTTGEFFPGELFFLNTPFAVTRINLIMFLMTGLLCLFFVVAFRKPQIVPRGIQNLGEILVDFVRVSIAEEILGNQAKRFVTYLTSLFFTLLFFNIAGILPLIHLSATSVIGLPILLSVITWVIYNYVGFKKHGIGGYFKMNLFPPGVPKPIYVILAPIEFVTVAVIRPVTLTIRLVANMMSGHLLLVLFFSATSFLLIEAQGAAKVFAVPSFLMGLAFTLFEILIAFLQAYIFTLLTAVYIQMSLSDEH